MKRIIKDIGKDTNIDPCTIIPKGKGILELEPKKLTYKEINLKEIKKMYEM